MQAVEGDRWTGRTLGAGFVEGFEEEEDCESLGYHISRLQNLKQLSLDDMPHAITSWKEFSWPASLAVANMRTGLMQPHSFLLIINQIAPNLRKLRLSCSEYLGRAPPREHQWKTEDSLKLPNFTELECCSKYINILNNFTTCKALEKLTWVGSWRSERPSNK